jgi:hypothetical protein
MCSPPKVPAQTPVAVFRTSILKADKSQRAPYSARLTALVRSLERRGAAAAEGVHGNEVCDACAYLGSEIAQISATAAVPLLILHVGPHPCSFRRSGKRFGAHCAELEPPIASG